MKRLYAILFFFLLAGNTMASHLMGGEITWTCLGGGQFRFTMRVYRDCNGIPMPQPATLRVHNNPNLTGIQLTLVSQIDISPQCNGSGPTINCAMGNTINPIPGAVEEFVFQSAPITLTGTPPPQGWIFTYDDCCRNNAITNLVNPGSTGMTLRAIMYSYNGLNESPCFDSSPVFAERPAIIICAGSPFQYNHNAYDPDLDSLHYEWASPLDELAGGPFIAASNLPPTLIFSGGYTIASPLPNPNQNPNNVGAVLNQSSGEVSFTPYTMGLFVTTVKVQSFKCGQLVAEIFREIQIVILNCGANFPPTVTPPFNGNTSFDLTVTAGDLVNFDLDGLDTEYLPIGTQQSVTITSTGGQYGANFTNPNAGCNFPPCATLQPPSPIQGTPGQGASTTFNWQTDCNHIAQNPGCIAETNRYVFVFRVRDDYCPAPSQNIVTVTITVVAQPTEPSPDLRCVSVLPNGDVQLTWIPVPNLVNTFDSYHIYSSTSANGPFTVVDSIFNINTATYTHVGAGANSQSIYYMIKTRSGCGGIIFSPPLDTLQSIYLSVTDPSNGTVGQLDWNPLSTPPPPTSLGTYSVFKDFPLGTWNQIGTTQALTYSDPLNVCSDSIYYRVEIGDASGCTSSSNIDGELFQNITPPAGVVIDSVSVDANGNAIIGWEPAVDIDVVGYIIYQNIGGNWVPIDTVAGYNNTSYINPNSTADAASEQYAIAAYDSCGGYGNYGQYHQTIYLQADVDACTGEALLDWNAYINMVPSQNSFNVFVSQNNGPYSLVGSVGATTTNYTAQSLQPGITYCYFVQATDANGTVSSSSNTACVTTDSIQLPQYLYLNRATVLPNKAAFVSALVDTLASVAQYNLYRALSGAPFNMVTTLVRAPGSEFVFYTDNAAETDSTSYYYQVTAVDKCGLESLVSNPGRTILLEGDAGPDLANSLAWNPYSVWDAGVERYNLYRRIDAQPNYTLIATMPAGVTLTYNDNVENQTQGNGLFCYYVEAIENNGNQYGLKDTSRSNILCLQQLETVYIPNAFTPEGDNRIFLPVGTFIKDTDYYFGIFNRWGQEVYSTVTPGEGWDGTYQGSYAKWMYMPMCSAIKPTQVKMLRSWVGCCC
ncbi:MAG: gliding motility-associated C-terminal domain-containing protein [Sphingobacteriales bacterium JAD_PAG50586_3]|nr:MAG: gliding motility-associated C-terminal domain-containing protein [Sphingobacteriales bacterium JAD_PAG50586_3]